MLSSKAVMSKGLGLRISNVQVQPGKSILLCTASRPMRVSYSATFLLPSGYSKQHISTTSPRGQEVTEKKEKGYSVFLAEKTPHIKRTETAWPHPPFDEKEMKDIIVAHRPTKGISDRIAYNAVRFLRWGMDTATGYKPKGKDMDHAFTEREWLIRIIFLESIAGVPGMVGGMLRHLHSLRRLKRDNGWIETLLEEAFNERMHLLTFLSLRSPGIFMRLMLLGAQGVFFNAFFLSYLFSSKTCHRFVGYLEEEAVITYTHCIANLEAGKLPLWEHMEAPQIAIDYWKMPEGHRMMGDLIYYVRADEAKHREVNHTLGNLDQNLDPNPFVSEYTDPNYPHPSKGLKNIKSTGWTRDEAL